MTSSTNNNKKKNLRKLNKKNKSKIKLILITQSSCNGFNSYPHTLYILHIVHGIMEVTFPDRNNEHVMYAGEN